MTQVNNFSIIIIINKQFYWHGITEHEQFFFYMYQYTVNGTRMISLVSVASPELIVTWGPVEAGSGYNGDDDAPITYELKTKVSTFYMSL